MSRTHPKPLIGIPVNVHELPEHTILIHGTGESYVRAAQVGAGAVPMLIPALGAEADLSALIDHLDGLMLPGGRANIEPHHYGGSPFPDDEVRDPARDATVLPLIRACIDAGVPVLGTCRGIQEINVALGGSLHYRVHQVTGMMDHRMGREGDLDHKFRLKHSLALTPGGLLADLASRTDVTVNSLHGQGIDRLADGLVVEATAPDGLIEAVRLEGASSFTLGVQWHAEWGFEEHSLSRALFEAFGEAARGRAAAKADRGTSRRLSARTGVRVGRSASRDARSSGDEPGRRVNA